MMRYGLRDDQFSRIENLLPGRPGTVGRNRDRGNRLLVDAVIWKFRAGRAVARFAGTFRRLVQHPQALLAVGCERGLGEAFQGFGR